MTDKLTLADCMKYPEAQIDNKNKRILYRNIIAFVVHHPISDEMEYEISFCKLILRDISELTDEEKEYLSKFLSITYREVEKYLYGQEMLNFAFKESLHIAEYLRSKNVMIEPEDWFKSGKAVEG